MSMDSPEVLCGGMGDAKQGHEIIIHAQVQGSRTGWLLHCRGHTQGLHAFTKLLQIVHLAA